MHSALRCLSVCQHTVEAEMEKPWEKKMRSFATERERKKDGGEGKKMVEGSGAESECKR